MQLNHLDGFCLVKITEYLSLEEENSLMQSCSTIYLKLINNLMHRRRWTVRLTPNEINSPVLESNLQNIMSNANQFHVEGIKMQINIRLIQMEQDAASQIVNLLILLLGRTITSINVTIKSEGKVKITFFSLRLYVQSNLSINP